MKRDHTFEAPDTISSGPMTIRLVNEGPDLHHVWLVRLESGRTVGDLVSLPVRGEKAMPDWAVDIGGTIFDGVWISPGRESRFSCQNLTYSPGMIE